MKKKKIIEEKKDFEFFKSKLPKDDDERFEILCKAIKEMRKASSKDADYNESECILSLCKNLDLSYQDYKALSVWAIIN